jgi:outer membrane protein insertion porin family
MSLRTKILAAALPLLLPCLAWAGMYDGKIIRKIEVTGPVTMLPEAVLYYTDFKEGEPYTETSARREYRRIWQSGLFRQLDMRVEPWEDGVKVLIHAVEKPILRSVEYKGAKRLTEKRIEDILTQNNVRLAKGEPIRYADMQKAQQLLKALLETKGYKYASVRTDLREVGKNELALTFDMDPGVRISIRKINFEGNQSFSNRRLRRVLKEVGEPTLLNSFRKKHVLNEAKLYDGLQNIIDFYRDRGYATFAMMDPHIEVKDVGKGKIKRQRAFIEVTMREGELYHIGDVTIQGNTVIPDEKLQSLLTVRKGDLYNYGKIEKFRTEASDLYGKDGYIFAHVGMVPKPTPETRVVNLVFDIEEGIPYHLRRLTFRGNTMTRDYVLRREMALDEGDLFNMENFERSIRKINGLGYFRFTGAPVIERVPGEPGLADVTVHGQEEKRNEINFGGGYSGLEGFFIRASFSTKNFKGRGEQADFMAQLGGRQDLYTVGYVWPWIFNHPYSLGVSLYRQSRQFVQFEQVSTGGRVTVGVPVTFFSRFYLAYSYERTDTQGRGDFGDQLSLLSIGKLTEVQVTPTFQFDSRNNPYVPSKGTFFRASLPVSHWAFGSDVSFYKLFTQWTHYYPSIKNSYFSTNFSGGYAQPFPGHRIPAAERYFLGGAGSVRGFETRSIGPAIDEIVYGGDLYLQFNAEYVVPVGDIFQFAFFADAGDAWALKNTRTVYQGNLVDLQEGFSLSGMPASLGLEFRFFMPIFPYPVRLIWSVPVQSEPWQRTRTFEFSIGPTF